MLRTNKSCYFDLIFSIFTFTGSIIYFIYFPHKTISRAYFFFPDRYILIITLFSVMTFIYSLLKRKNKTDRYNFFIFTLAFIFSCFLIDIAYGTFKVTIPIITQSKILRACIKDANGYLIDRSYQYVAIIFLSVFIMLRPGKKQSYLSVGNIKKETDILGGKTSSSWLSVILKISFLFTCSSLFLMYLRWDHSKAITLPAKVIGGINNSVIEEFLFRALYLTMLCTFMKKNTANHVQSFFFSYVHLHWDLIFGTSAVFLLLVKFVLYYALGWFFGKMTFETGGIFSSCILHSVITVGIWLSMPTF